MTKYYFISFIHRDENGTSYGHCIMKAHNLDLTKIAWRLQTNHKFKNMPIILGLKDLSKKEFENADGSLASAIRNGENLTMNYKP